MCYTRLRYGDSCLIFDKFALDIGEFILEKINLCPHLVCLLHVHKMLEIVLSNHQRHLASEGAGFKACLPERGQVLLVVSVSGCLMVEVHVYFFGIEC